MVCVSNADHVWCLTAAHKHTLHILVHCNLLTATHEVPLPCFVSFPSSLFALLSYLVGKLADDLVDRIEPLEEDR